MFIDSPRPIFFYIEDCVKLDELRRDLHTSYQNTLKILEAEGITIYRHWHGQRHSCYVYRIDARRMTLKHGSEHARRLRMLRSAARTKGSPLMPKCRLCGQVSRQWRNGYNCAGHRRIKCGHCMRCYTIRHLPAVQSTCVHCGNVTQQWRHCLTSAGNLTIRCGQCRRYYTVAGTPPPAPEWVRPRPPLDLIEW